MMIGKSIVGFEVSYKFIKIAQIVTESRARFAIFAVLLLAFGTVGLTPRIKLNNSNIYRVYHRHASDS